MSQLKFGEYAQQEVKFLEIDANDIERRLIDIGAIKVYHGPRKQVYFDYPTGLLTDSCSRVRVTVEDKIKLEYSTRLEDNTRVTIKVFVSREKEITDFLIALGLNRLFTVVSYRISYEIPAEAVDFDIDSWPGIPPFLELDAPDSKTMGKYALLLGLNPQHARRMTTRQIYEYYKVNITDVASKEPIDIKVDDSLDRFVKLFGTGIGRVHNSHGQL